MEGQSFEHCNFDTSCAMKYFELLIFNLQTEDLQKQPFRDVLRKKCSENMRQIYRRAPTSSCHFNKATSGLKSQS